MALFKISDNNKIKKINFKQFKNEAELHKLCEANLEELFQVRFLERKFRFGDEYNGEMDTIGLDHEGNPVIIEYKLDKNQAVLSQALFYMDWLVNHKGDFELVAKEKFGNDTKVLWNNPKMMIVAQDYNRYDKYAVNQINYDIYLYKYIYYENGELYLENINVQENKKYYVERNHSTKSSPSKYSHNQYDLDYHLNNASAEIKEIFNELSERILELNDQIEVRYPKTMISFRTTRNFAEIHIKKNFVQCYVLLHDEKIDTSLRLEKVPESYQWVVDTRFNISSLDEIDEAIKVITKSYENTL